MSTIIKGESLEGRGAEDSPDEAVYRRRYYVIADSISATEADIWALTGLPQPWSQCPENGAALMCRRKTDRDSTAPKKWVCEFEWSTKARDPAQISTKSATQSPLERLKSKEFETQPRVVNASVDIYGRGLVSSAGTPFEGIQGEENDLIMTIEWNQSTDPDNEFVAYGNAINNADWHGGAKFTWKITKLVAKDDFQQGIYFWRCRAQFTYREDGWLHKELDRSFTVLTISGKRMPWSVQNDGSAASEPALLNGKGEPLYEWWDENAVAPATFRTERSTFLVGLISATQTNIGVPAGGFDRFPALPFYLQIADLGFPNPDDEIVRVVEPAGLDFRVERGAMGTTAFAHSASTKLFMAPVYGSYFVKVYPLNFNVFIIP